MSIPMAPESGIHGSLTCPDIQPDTPVVPDPRVYAGDTYAPSCPQRVYSTKAFLETICGRPCGRRPICWKPGRMPPGGIGDIDLAIAVATGYQQRVDSIWFEGTHMDIDPVRYQVCPACFMTVTSRSINRYPTIRPIRPSCLPSGVWGWIIPQAWTSIMERLAWNDIRMHRIVEIPFSGRRPLDHQRGDIRSAL